VYHISKSKHVNFRIVLEWEEMYTNIKEALGLSEDAPVPNIPRSEKSKSSTPPAGIETSNPAYTHAQAAAAYISFLDTPDLLPPKMPTRAEMEGVLLDLKKKALVEEYFGNDQMAT